MATQDLEKLVVQLSADFKSFEREMAKAQGITTRELRKMESQASTSLGAMQQTFASFAKGVAAGITIEAFRRFGAAVLNMVDQTAQLGEAADNFGFTTHEMQALARAAAQAGTPFDDLTAALKKFVKEVATARTGKGDLAALAKKFDVTFTGDTFQDLKKVADLINRAADAETAAKIAGFAFGNSYLAMLEVMKSGSKGLDDSVVQLNKVGTAIEDNLVKKSQEAKKEFTTFMFDLGNSAKEGAVTGVLAVVEAVKGLGEAFDALRRKIPSIPFLGKGAKLPPGVTTDVIDLEKIRAAPGTNALPPPTKKGPVVTLPTEEEIEKAKKKKEALEDLRQATYEYDVARGEAFANSVDDLRKETQELERENETFGMTTAQREAYLREQELINMAMENGLALTPEMRQRITELAEGYGAAAAKAEELAQFQETLTETGNAFKSAATGFVQAIASGVAPIDALNDALGRLADQLLDMATNQLITMLFKNLASFAGGLGGGIKPAAGSGLFPGVVPHGGGIVGSSIHTRRSVPASTFVGAPRLHNGLGVDEFPAILQRGEMVIPRGGARRGGGYGRVVVNNYGGQIERREQRGKGGEPELHLWFKASFQRELASPQTAKTLGAGFGVAPLKKRR